MPRTLTVDVWTAVAIVNARAGAGAGSKVVVTVVAARRLSCEM